MIVSLEGLWRAALPGFEGDVRLPGTLDENGIGGPDACANAWHPDAEAEAPPHLSDSPIETRLTRRHTFEAEVRLTRRIDFALPEGARAFFEVERARCLRLLVDGEEAPHFLPPSLSTPQVFEITGRIHPGAVLTLLSDNGYPGLPREDILSASAATDETQTNWNGALGYVRLRTERQVFLRAVRVYPHSGRVAVRLEISAAQPYAGKVCLTCEAMGKAVAIPVDLPPGEHTVAIDGISLTSDTNRWDEDEGNLCTLTASLENGESKSVRFGVRDFGDDGTGRLALNGRRVFVRGETNCAVFPETGHPPMDAAAWTEILRAYRAYGANLVRFHSWCPPEAAFQAADALGMLMQPELSCWNPRNAFESDAAWDYYRRELRAILSAYANHPSFVMLTLGNELHAGTLGHGRMNTLLEMARRMDDTRLYANGSNAHYGEKGCDPASDFYTASTYLGEPLRAVMAGTRETGGALAGHINGDPPSTNGSYGAVMEKLRREYAGPVLGFEVGQYEILPDFEEIEAFHGVTDPVNLRMIRDRAAEKGLLRDWPARVEASGELALRCYREEVEAALRTPAMSGLALLGLQDFPGQGTALVGMLNSHLRPKPFSFAKPERFASFFRAQLPMARMDRYTWVSGETLRLELMVANYGKTALPGPMRWRLTGGGAALAEGSRDGCFPAGCLSGAGTLEIPLDKKSEPSRLTLSLMVGGAENAYPLWVYPPTGTECPEGIVEADSFEDAWAALREGRRVFLDPPSTPEALPGSIRAHFSTDFWSVRTFPWQSGSMGQLIDAAHPIFRRFPTESHTDWQWWPMASRRAVILPRAMKAIVAELDSCATLRPMAQLFECRVGLGRLVFSSMNLRGLTGYPEARALLRAIYDYMASDAFAPKQALTPEELQHIVK